MPTSRRTLASMTGLVASGRATFCLLVSTSLLAALADVPEGASSMKFRV